MLPALHALIQAAARFSTRTAFVRVADEFEPRKFGGSMEELAAIFELEEGDPLGTFAEGALGLMTGGRDPLITLQYLPDPITPVGAHDQVQLSFRLDQHLVGPEGHFSMDELIEFLRVCLEAFGAQYGWIYDSQLMEVVNARMTKEENRRQSPKSEWDSIIDDKVTGVPDELVQRIGHLQHPYYFDIHEVPAAIYWINYWNRTQIERLGEARVRDAGWARIEPGPADGLILVAVDDAFDALDPDHLTPLAEITERLELFDAQTRALKRKPKKVSS